MQVPTPGNTPEHMDRLKNQPVKEHGFVSILELLSLCCPNNRKECVQSVIVQVLTDTCGSGTAAFILAELLPIFRL